MNSYRIFTEKDLEDLISRDLAFPPDEMGIVRVHCRYMHSTSDAENRNIPLPGTLLKRTSSHSPKLTSLLIGPGITVADTAYERVPVTLCSLATLEHIGYSPAKAAPIWSEWTNWEPGTPPLPRDIDVEGVDFGGLVMGFYNFITGPVAEDTIGDKDVYLEGDEEWVKCMDGWGIAEWLKEAIMDPRFRDMSRSIRVCFGSGTRWRCGGGI